MRTNSYFIKKNFNTAIRIIAYAHTLRIKNVKIKYFFTSFQDYKFSVTQIVEYCNSLNRLFTSQGTASFKILKNCCKKNLLKVIRLVLLF